MAWGYWSATSVSDRGRSPRREKDKQHQSLHQSQQQAQQQMHQQELQSTYSTVQQERELGVAATGMGVAKEEPPCSMMIQGSSFYSYSAATAAAATAAASRRISAVVEGGGPSSSATVSGIQVLPRERPVKPSTSTYPPTPGSGGSAEYEQPLIATSHPRIADISPPLSRIGGSSPPLPPHHHHQDEIFAQPSTSSSVSRTSKILQCPPSLDVAGSMDNLSEAELDEITAEMIYSRTIIGPTATCRLHGPCNQQPPPPPPVSLLDVEPVGSSQFQFNEISWGRCEPIERVCSGKERTVFFARETNFALVL